MKSQSNSLGNSSTNARALSTRISNIMTELKPTITVTKVRSNPDPAMSGTYQWIERRVRVVLSTTAGTSTNLTIGDLATAYGSTVGAVKIMAFSAWSVPTNGTSELTIVTASDLITTGSTMAASDYGGGASFAGLRFNIPDTLAKSLALDNAAAIICGATSNGTKVIFDVTARVRTTKVGM